MYIFSNWHAFWWFPRCTTEFWNCVNRQLAAQTCTCMYQSCLWGIHHPVFRSLLYTLRCHAVSLSWYIYHSDIPQAKHLQFVSGVHSTSYWMSTLAWDLINASVPVVLSVIMFAAFQVDGFTGDGLAAVALLLVRSCLNMVYDQAHIQLDVRMYRLQYIHLVCKWPTSRMALER